MAMIFGGLPAGGHWGSRWLIDLVGADLGNGAQSPTSAVIGGGGIALLAGMSGIFTFPHFVASVSVAALPVPLVVILSRSGHNGKKPDFTGASTPRGSRS